MATETMMVENSLQTTSAQTEMSAAELRTALLALTPQTEMGRDLIALALRGLAEGVARLSPEEIQLYLGRERNAENLS